MQYGTPRSGITIVVNGLLSPFSAATGGKTTGEMIVIAEGESGEV
jgi:hypothetical protein